MNVQMFLPIIKQETVQCCDEKETNCDNYMSEYKSLKSPNCVNYYDGQFCASVKVKKEFPEDEYPHSSTAASCINRSGIDSNIVYENEELSKVLETQEIKQEVSEEAFSFIKTEEIHDKNDKFIATTEISEEYRVLGNAGDTSVLYKGQTTHQEIQQTMCGGILKNRFNSLTHNNEHIKIETPTLVGDEGKELPKCQYCDAYFHYDNYGRIFECWCGKQFPTQIHLRQHKNKQHGANSKSTNNAVLKKEFQCDTCKKTFKRKYILKIHITNIHYDYGKTFKCWCGKQFRTPRQLYQHKNRQHGANVNTTIKSKLQCDVCKKTFKRKGGLRTHILDIHYNYGKTFNCWCGKQFRTPNHLHRHKKSQHDAKSKERNNAAFEKKIRCDICEKTFKKKSILRGHIKSIHYDYGKTFKCWCGKQFRTPKYLNQHKNRQHGANVNSANNTTIKTEV